MKTIDIMGIVFSLIIIKKRNKQIIPQINTCSFYVWTIIYLISAVIGLCLEIPLLRNGAAVKTADRISADSTLLIGQNKYLR
jgi:hypothetical protein